MTAIIIFSLIGILAIATLIKHPTLLIVGAIMLVVGLLFGRLALGLAAFGVVLLFFTIGRWALTITPSKKPLAAQAKPFAVQQELQKEQQMRRIQEEQWAQSKKYHSGQ